MTIRFVMTVLLQSYALNYNMETGDLWLSDY